MTTTNIDITAAAGFMASHARLLDRQRLGHVLGPVGPEHVLAALDAYRNPDGGYGWGLEADLRSPESQPSAALHAFEAIADTAPARSSRAIELCEWLDSITLADGGVPFAFPLTDPAGSARWWLDPDPSRSSLQITAAVAAQAHRVADHDPAVAEHRWLTRATDYCLETIGKLTERPGAYEFGFAIQLADRCAPRRPAEAKVALERLLTFLPDDGQVPVPDGVEGEALHVLDFTPWPDGPVRTMIDNDMIARDLERLAALQQPDGGWIVDFVSASPAAVLEWRGYATVEAITILRSNGQL